MPFFGFLSGSLFGKFFGNTWVPFIASLLVVQSIILSVITLGSLIYFETTYTLDIATWISVDNLEVRWSFYVDSLAAIMLVVVTSISSCVHVYSTEYMKNDPHLSRFMSYLSLFTFFMLILITANNFLQMFVGWEGVGVSSYLLINFWFTRVQANKAAIKAMLLNRVGDFCLLLAIFVIYFLFNSLDYDIVFTLVPLVLDNYIIIGGIHFPAIDLICFLLFIGAMGKSAQLGLHTWLPDAMEGPTPVSALIHAATMVTAGVFLIARCSYLFEFSPAVLNFITIIGSSTAFFAATTGLFQNDIKKVIAYSTCSQLGYMIFACGLSSYDVAIFHLSNHAFFKALLFLGAGSIIHSLSDEQDLRRMGGLKKILPFTYAVMTVGSLALIGFPFLAGFYSKDVILELSISKSSIEGHFAFFLGILAAFCTAFYSARLLFLVFLSNPNGNKNVILNAHENPIEMTFPLFLLSLFSIFIGYFSKDMLIGFGSDFWVSSIFINPSNYLLADIEFLATPYKIMPLIFTLLGFFLAFYIYNSQMVAYLQLKKTAIYKHFYNFLNKKWFFDRVYVQYLTQKIINTSTDIYIEIDRGLLEKWGPSGITNSLLRFTKYLSKFQSGQIIDYLYFWCIVTVLIGYIILFLDI